MSCSFSGEFQALEKSFIEEINEHLSPIPKVNSSQFYQFKSESKIIELPRGGYIIKT
jgi:hypothetical protein